MCNHLVAYREGGRHAERPQCGRGRSPGRCPGRRPATRNATRPPQTPGQRWRAFVLLVVAYFITIVDFTIVNVALPTIGRRLHFSESELQWVVTAYGLTYAGFLLLGGRAADLLGRRRLLMTGLIIFTGGSLGGGLATSDTFLIVMRGIQGLGAALILPAALSMVMNMFPEGAERNKALGIWGGVGALGGDGRAAGRRCPHHLRRLAVHLPLQRPHRRGRAGADPPADPREPGRQRPGGATTRSAPPRSPPRCWSSSTRSRRRRRSAGPPRRPSPCSPPGPCCSRRSSSSRRKLRRRCCRCGCSGSGAWPARTRSASCWATSFFTFVFIGTLYMQQVLGFSALATGAAWMIASVTSLAFAGLSQKIVTRTSPKAVMAFGMTLIGAGILWAAQAPANGNFWRDLAGPFFVAGIGTAFTFIPISIGALTGVAERDAGVASGLLNTSQNLGSVIGVAVASSIAASHFHILARHGSYPVPRSPAASAGPVGVRARRPGRRTRGRRPHAPPSEGSSGRNGTADGTAVRAVMSATR